MIDFIQEKFTLVFILINVLFHYVEFSLSFIDAFQYHMTNPKTYWESPEMSPGLICGKTHLPEHKIDQICKILVLSVGQGPTSGDCHIINMANGLICATVSPQTTP